MAGLYRCRLRDRTRDASPPLQCRSAVVDWDNDGDLDIFISGHGWVNEALNASELGPANPSFLFENQDGRYVDIGGQLPQDVQDAYTFVGGFFDADRDGDLDLYMVNDLVPLMPCKLLHNDGTGQFTADNNASLIDAEIAGMGLAIGDYDKTATKIWPYPPGVETPCT